jgi:transcriptional regulator NrdR family protein
MSESATPAVGNVIGLICRKCGHQRFWVLYTRAARGGRVIRRRACQQYRTRITTWERAVGG